MALVRPPITGDPQLDSWTDQLTRQINQGLVPGSSGTTIIDGGGGTGRPGTDGMNGLSAVSVYMYQRSATRALGPTEPPTDALYRFSDGSVTLIPGDANGDLRGWTTDIPDETAGPYLWVILQYIAVSSEFITDDLISAAWTDIRTLAEPPASPITIILESDVGLAFRGEDTGQIIEITAAVYIAGELQSDTAHMTYLYDWKFMDTTLYVTDGSGSGSGPYTVIAGTNGQPSIIPGNGGVAAVTQLDPDMPDPATDLANLRTIRVPDIAVSNMAQITCDISNIPDDPE